MLEIEDGKLAAVSGNSEFAMALTELLDSVGPDGRNVAEIGIGLNPSAMLTGNVLEDEKVEGTVHIAFGDNAGFDGSVSVPLHIDCVTQTAVAVIE